MNLEYEYLFKSIKLRLKELQDRAKLGDYFADQVLSLCRMVDICPTDHCAWALLEEAWNNYLWQIDTEYHNLLELEEENE